MPQNKILKDFKKLYRLYDDGRVFVAFDTETTALSPTTGRILEIGAVKFSKYGILGTWASLFNPEQTISETIENLTSITNEMVIHQPKIETKLGDFYSFISDTILIAHNAQFDLNFLNFELIKSNLPASKNKVIDTHQYARWAYPELGKYSLEYFNRYFNLGAKKLHRAQDDAESCMKLFLKIINDTRI